MDVFGKEFIFWTQLENCDFIFFIFFSFRLFFIFFVLGGDFDVIDDLRKHVFGEYGVVGGVKFEDGVVFQFLAVKFVIFAMFI